MSGIYKPLVVGLGAVSILLVVYVVRRMDQVDGDAVDIRLRPLHTIGYVCWLLIEIAKSNLAVTRIILSPIMTIRPHMFPVPYSQKTDLGQVIFANSITLTPGTLSVETDLGYFLVHAISYAPEDMDGLAEMDRRVSATENLREA